MKVIILSLPIPEIYDKYQRGNHQLFCEYIEALVKLRSIKGIEIIKLDRGVVDGYNNRKIAEEILNLKPDVVCFSSYVWNIERNIEIAKKIRGNGIITITGGPEIQFDNEYLFNNDVFDYYVIGEGENRLLDILINIKNRIAIEKISSGSPIDFNEFLYEYLSITNQFQFDKLFYLEVERGCQFKCSYCAYGKARDIRTEIDIELFKSITSKLYNLDNIEELYLLSPTLNYNKFFFKEILKHLSYLRKNCNNNISIFAELRPEFIDKKDVILLRESGFKAIEIGIQSINKMVIDNIKRDSKKFSLKELCNFLIENNIDLIIDFIIGLPEDDFYNILKTIEYLDKINLLKYCNFYRLQVLHSTELKKSFSKKNFLYQKEPPYFVINTDKIIEKEIKDIYLYLENNMNFSYNEDFFINNKEQLFILKTENDLNNFVKNNYYYHSASLLFIDNFDFNKVLSFFNDFFNLNPEIFHHCYIYSKNRIVKNNLNKIKDLFYSYKNYYDRYNDATNFLKDPLSKRITILVDYSCSIQYIQSLYSDYNIDFIIFNENDYEKVIEIADEFDMNIFEYKDDILIHKDREVHI